MTHLSPATRGFQDTLGPAAPLQRLARPLEVIELPTETIFYYIKVGAAAGSVSLRRMSPEVAREVAMIVVNRAAGRFTLQWYPWADKPQVVADLPFSELATAVSDLVAAGFGAPQAPAAQKPVPNPCNSLSQPVIPVTLCLDP